MESWKRKLATVLIINTLVLVYSHNAIQLLHSSHGELKFEFNHKST